MTEEPRRPRRPPAFLVGVLLAMAGTATLAYLVIPSRPAAPPVAQARPDAAVATVVAPPPQGVGGAPAPQFSVMQPALERKPGDLPPGIWQRLRPGWEYLPGTKDTLVASREIVVKLRSSLAPEALQRFNQENGTYITSDTEAGLRLVLPDGMTVSDGLRRLKADERVASVDPVVITPELEAAFASPR